LLILRKILLLDYLYYILIFIVLLSSVIFTLIYQKESFYTGEEVSISGRIEKLSIDGDKLSLIIKAREKVIVNYYFDSFEEKESFSLEIGDYISVKGIMVIPSSNRNFNCFNYKKYLYNNNIFYIMNSDKYILVKKNDNFLIDIKNKLLKRSNNKYVSAFIFGETNNIDANVFESYRKNGISHLFAISGMHVGFFSMFLLWIFKKTREYIRYLIVSLFIMFYLFLAGFSPSILRAGLLFVFLFVNRQFNFNIKPINILLLLGSLLIIFNPYYIYDLGFQLSFVISFFLIKFSYYFNGKYIKVLFFISLFAFITSFPIIANNFYEVNLLSPLLNIIFVPFVSIIIFPLSLLVFIFPFLDFLLIFLADILEWLSLFFSNVNVLMLVLPKINIIFILIYYILIYLMLLKLNRYIIGAFILMVIVHANLNLLNFNPYMVMIDVGQGDSILFVLPHNKGNILIDTGGHRRFYKEEWRKRNKEYSFAKSTSITIFKSFGINHLDYLVLTHGDYDHLGEALGIMNNFKVDEVILNDGNINYNEQLIMDLAGKYSFNKDIIIGEYSFKAINKIDYNNENDNSIVYYVSIGSKNILLTGDISLRVELDLIKRYDLSDVDVLKLAHHGSNTSSVYEFLSKVRPDLVLISVGLNNKFKHPSNEVIERLNNIGVNYLSTMDNKSIKLIFRSDKISVKLIL